MRETPQTKIEFIYESGSIFINLDDLVMHLMKTPGLEEVVRQLLKTKESILERRRK